MTAQLFRRRASASLLTAAYLLYIAWLATGTVWYGAAGVASLAFSFICLLWPERDDLMDVADAVREQDPWSPSPEDWAEFERQVNRHGSY